MIFPTTSTASEMARYMKTVKGKSVEGHCRAMYSWNEKIHRDFNPQAMPPTQNTPMKGESIHGKKWLNLEMLWEITQPRGGLNTQHSSTKENIVYDSMCVFVIVRCSQGLLLLVDPCWTFRRQPSSIHSTPCFWFSHFESGNTSFLIIVTSKWSSTTWENNQKRSLCTHVVFFFGRL